MHGLALGTNDARDRQHVALQLAGMAPVPICQHLLEELVHTISNDWKLDKD
jgi:hypothetical protein